MNPKQRQDWIFKTLKLDVIPEKKEEPDKKISMQLFEYNLNKYQNNLNWVKEYIVNKNIYKCKDIIRTQTNYYYVYGLINKKTGHIFYIGKGIYDRLYDHEKEVKESEKTKYINEIGKENIHYWIIENGLEKGMALSLESYLINKIPDLTNIVIPNITFEYCIYLHYLHLLLQTLEDEIIIENDDKTTE